MGLLRSTQTLLRKEERYKPEVKAMAGNKIQMTHHPNRGVDEEKKKFYYYTYKKVKPVVKVFKAAQLLPRATCRQLSFKIRS